MAVKIRRVYEGAVRGDGKRILVDRLWPRGLSKEKAAVDVWAKDVAPSDALRKWFGHKPERWAEFQKRYRTELKANREAVAELRKAVGKGKATLVFGAKDEERNQAVVLREMLR